jgi:hypothetical protein
VKKYFSLVTNNIKPKIAGFIGHSDRAPGNSVPLIYAINFPKILSLSIFRPSNFEDGKYKLR